MLGNKRKAHILSCGAKGDRTGAKGPKGAKGAKGDCTGAKAAKGDCLLSCEGRMGVLLG